jgi:GNAT superfamily N-acetyltransferase
MTDDELIAGCDRNYFEAWRLLASASDQGIVEEENGVLIAAPGGTIVWLNIVFVTQPLGKPRAQLERAFDRLDERGMPFLLRIREGLDGASERAAVESLGLRYTDSIPGMALAPMPAQAATPPEGLDIRPVRDAATFGAFSDIIASTFDIDPSVCREVLTPKLVELVNAHWYLGYADGKPVAGSALITTDGVAGVHYVGTLASYRRRGFGEAMTRHAVDEGAKAGCRSSTLQASEMGQPIYERMGFRVVTSYKTFVRPEWTG